MNIFDHKKGYFIWIGSYVEVPNDINKINLNEYLFRGSIKVFELTDFYNLNRHYENFGGTVLQYSTQSLMFVKFAPYGKDTYNFFENTKYILSTIKFYNGSFNRIEHCYDVDGYKHIIVKTNNVSYVSSYGKEVDDYSVRMIYAIMNRLNYPEKYIDELAIHINLDNIDEPKDELFSFTSKKNYDNKP